MLKWFIYLFVLGSLLSQCGRAYFPMELKTESRSERSKGQDETVVELVAMNTKTISAANRVKYKRRVIDGSDLTKPARIISEAEALIENLPANNNPGPYVIGLGDQFSFSQLFVDEVSMDSEFVTRKIAVADDGYINLFEIGRVKAIGKTQAEIEDLIYQKFSESGMDPKFELFITGFKSKRIFVNGDKLKPTSIPFANTPIYLEDVLSKVGVNRDVALDTKVTIIREGKEYNVSMLKTLKGFRAKIRLFPNDRIYLSPLLYRKETVLIVGETGTQRAIPISSAQRPTLSETIFSGPILSLVTSDFSQIYVIRKVSKKLVAYHLDISNPGRISLASSFEMRPDDIIFVATQPLSLYSRALAQILGSTGVTIQARDQVRSELK